MRGLTQTSRGGLGRLCSVGVVVSGLCAITVALPIGQAEAASGTYVLRTHLERTASTVGAPRATGALTARLTVAGENSSFTWTLTFRHLSGTAVRAGIYYGKAAKPSQLAMLLCNKCISGARSYYHGSFVASPTFVRALRRGGAYVVIQTRKNPKGEIRGRMTAKAV